MTCRALFAAACLACASPAVAAPTAAAVPIESSDPARISEENLRRHVGLLASESYAGRGTDEWGGWMAQWHVARHFESLGLQPLPGEEDWFLDFALYQQGFVPDETTLSYGGREWEVGSDFRPFGFSDEGEVEAEVVFAGYGIRSEEHEWDDYEGLDVEGKIVFVLRHEPHEKDPNSSFDGEQSTRHAQFNVKAQVAEEAGARAMILVTDPLHHDDSDDLRLGGGFRLERPALGEEVEAASEEEPPFLAVQVSREAAQALLGSGGPDLADLQRAVDDGKKPAALGVKPIRARLAVERPETARRLVDRNVAAILPGSDPKLRDEWVIVGGHHDHLGGYEGSGDTVFNGADDNASGTAGVLELARSFAQRAERPRRSLVFMTFAAEEQGLLGSRAIVEQELLPLERVVYMLNLDMIGRNEDRPVAAWGDGYADGLTEIIEEANRSVGLKLDLGGSQYMGRSDHDPFYKRDVPFSFLFTGTHEDYHQLGDHAEKVAYARQRRIVELASGILERVANRTEPLRFIHHVDWIGAKVQVESRAGGEAAVVTAVDEGSRGAEAGLRAGDVVTGFDGTPLESASAVGRGFRGVEPGSTATIQLARAGAPAEITVERAKPGWIGLWPGEVEEDQRKALGLPDSEGFVVRRATEDGPAAKGGLKDGDVVLSLDGQPVTTSTLRSVLSRLGAGEEVDVLLVRDGERQTLKVTLGERPQRRR